MKKLIVASVLGLTALSAQAEYIPNAPHPEIEVRKLGAECKELMYAQAKPTESERAKGQIVSSFIDAFGKYGWKLNSKGQYVNFTCSRYGNYVMIAPKSVIDSDIAREKQARIDSQKASADRVKNSGLL